MDLELTSEVVARLRENVGGKKDAQHTDWSRHRAASTALKTAGARYLRARFYYCRTLLSYVVTGGQLDMYEVREPLRVGFVHDVSSVELYRSRGNSKQISNIFV